ncbi:MAG: DNA gyrase inhibitor YacG [Beijerinckiaceae bacterium]|nr:DNA gyrase inhibitor YacG [Beijerinckiaceae bacterium]
MTAARKECSAQQPNSGEPVRPCSICGKPAAHAFRPFCSKRCADIDLHRWLGGIYAVPAADEPDPGGSGESRGQGAESSEAEG